MNQQLVGWGRVGLVGLLRYMYEHRELNRSFATRANFFVSNQDMSRYSHIFPLTLLHPCACVQSAINPSTFLKRYFRLFLTHILLTTTPPPTIHHYSISCRPLMLQATAGAEAPSHAREKRGLRHQQLPRELITLF